MLLFAQYFILTSFLHFFFCFSHFFFSSLSLFDCISISIPRTRLTIRFVAVFHAVALLCNGQRNIAESILFNYVLGLSLCCCAFYSSFEILYFVEMHAYPYVLLVLSNSAHLYMKHNILLHFLHPSYSRALYW